MNRPLSEVGITSGPNGNLGAFALQYIYQGSQEPQTHLLYRGIHPWLAGVEAVTSGYERGLVNLAFVGTTSTMHYDDFCACAGGGSGGTYRVHRN